MLLNGPESFTPDGNFILGEAPELRGYFVCAGFNSAGIANAGGAGRLIAEWIVGGEPPFDVWDVDIRRFAPFHANRAAPRRSHRRDARPALRDALAARGARRPCGRCAARRCTTGSQRKGAVFGTQARLGARELFPAAGRGGAAAHARHARLAAVDARRAARVPRRRRRVRPDVVLQIRAEGPRRARACCERLCANEIDVPVGPHGLHGDAQRARRLRERPHRHARSRPNDSSSSPARRRRRATSTGSSAHIGDDEHASLVDVTSAYSMLSLMGPRAEALLATLSRRRPLEGGDAVRARRATIDVGYARVRAARMSYVGGPGYELYVPTDQCVTLYDALCERRRGVRPARRRLLHDRRAAHRGGPPRLGRRAVAGRDAARSRPRVTRSRSTSRAFIGRDALLRQRARGVHEAARAVHARRSGGVRVGRRADPDGWARRRRDHVGRLQPQARPHRRVRLCEGARRAVDPDRRDDSRCALCGRHRRAAMRGDGPPARTAVKLASCTTLHRLAPPARRGRTPSRPGTETAQVQSLTRGLSILECLAQSEGGLTLTDVAQRAQLAPSTAHRLLATLEKTGLRVPDGRPRPLVRGPPGVHRRIELSRQSRFRHAQPPAHAPADGAMRRNGEPGDPRRHRSRLHRPGAVPRDDAHDRQARQPRAAARFRRRQGDLRRAARRPDRRADQGEGAAAHHREHDHVAGDDVGRASA